MIEMLIKLKHDGFWSAIVESRVLRVTNQENFEKIEVELFS